jgi:hypothetical protein
MIEIGDNLAVTIMMGFIFGFGAWILYLWYKQTK